MRWQVKVTQGKARLPQVTARGVVRSGLQSCAWRGLRSQAKGTIRHSLRGHVLGPGRDGRWLRATLGTLAVMLSVGWDGDHHGFLSKGKTGSGFHRESIALASVWKVRPQAGRRESGGHIMTSHLQMKTQEHTSKIWSYHDHPESLCECCSPLESSMSSQTRSHRAWVGFPPPDPQLPHCLGLSLYLILKRLTFLYLPGFWASFLIPAMPPSHLFTWLSQVLVFLHLLKHLFLGKPLLSPSTRPGVLSTSVGSLFQCGCILHLWESLFFVSPTLDAGMPKGRLAPVLFTPCTVARCMIWHPMWTLDQTTLWVE